MLYFFRPETAQLSWEEVVRNLGDEVARHIHDVKGQDKLKLHEALMPSEKSEFSNSQMMEADVNET
ncbi:hypothetical protein HBH61_234570 [Parastagonospora nodorum]|nr:hypothetical protein HBH61_234570 [Parastagonospora nodorum]KAH5397673.1 hypothetical protein HBI47_212780 [Parastagonospora nodorum]KAH5701855.1 hypothetical protein HBI44_034380 [Parastagonospora nodorum]KAH6529974.1 hypothetical protein HBI07_172170 [Parastagonospora nodorum]